MAILLTKAGRVQLARSFHRDIFNARDIYHFTLGKTTAWDDEEFPDTPLNSEKFLKEVRNNIIFTQSVSSADICHLVRRINWTSGTVYDLYDDAYSAVMPAYSGATSLAEANFYVITDELKVYKCIDNNNNSPSTVKPNYTNTDTDDTEDGYRWKFMFQVSSSDETKFLDAEHIPVRKLTGNPRHDVNGELDDILVTNGGSGYTSIPTVVINGDGINASATAIVEGGIVTDIVVDEPGSGYSFANITFTGGNGGTGAEATVLLGDSDDLPALQKAVEEGAISGSVDRIEILDGGTDYRAEDVVVTITGDGTGAVATATVVNGAVTKVNIDAKGSGYTKASVSITDASGANVTSDARIILSPIDGHGSHPINELYSTTIGLTVSLSENSNSDLFLDNDFRQVGLIKNITNYDKTATWINSTATACFVVNVSSSEASKYDADDLITTNTGGEFIVVQKNQVDNEDTFNIHLQSIIPIIEYSGSLRLNNTTKGLLDLIINSVVNPEINTSTGEVVYVENRPAISRSIDQVETIKALVNF